MPKSPPTSARLARGSSSGGAPPLPEVPVPFVALVVVAAVVGVPAAAGLVVAGVSAATGLLVAATEVVGAATGLVLAGVEVVRAANDLVVAGVPAVAWVVVAGVEVVWLLDLERLLLPSPATSAPPASPTANAPPTSATTSHVVSFRILDPSLARTDAPDATPAAAVVKYPWRSPS
jgi:hypothetical protein